MVYRGQGDTGAEATSRTAVGSQKKTAGLVDVFEELWAKTRPAFKQERVFQKTRRLAISSLVALGKRNISGLLCAGAEQFVDWSAAYRIFAKGRIDRQALFAPARDTVIDRLSPDESLVVMMDDTLIRKRGRKVHGSGWKRDPLGPHFCDNFVWGQRFLQMPAALPDRDCNGRARAIPLDFMHAPSANKPRKKASDEEWKKYRALQSQMKVSTLAADKLRQLRKQVDGKQIICSVDGGFTNRTVFRDIPVNTTLIGRIRKDAKLYGVPEDENACRRGRRKFYGEALPTPDEVRRDEAIPWQKVEAYAAGKRHNFDVKVMPLVRWKGTGERNVQVVVVRPLAYRPRKGAHLLYRNPVYLLCTDDGLDLAELIQAYLWRWEIELNFKEEKTAIGVGEAEVRTEQSVESAPALVVAAYAYMLLAGTDERTTQTSLPRPKWQQPQENERTSAQQMRNLFRAQLWQITIDKNKTHFANEKQKCKLTFIRITP